MPSALQGVAGRLLRGGELAGYNPQGSRVLGENVNSWVVADQYPPFQRAKVAAALRRLGFVAAVREHLAPTSGNPSEAISVAQQFRTPSGARAQLANEARLPGGATTFSVAGIPDARGFGGSSPEGSGQNVAFTKGAYFYLVGMGAPNGVSLPSRATLEAAATHLYRRVQP